MYWLVSEQERKQERVRIDALVRALAAPLARVHDDQLFPYVGRKDRRVAHLLLEGLTDQGDTVLEPFAGSGVLAYAIAGAGRRLVAGEWEPYAHRMACAPWRLPDDAALDVALATLAPAFEAISRDLYATRCTCGAEHVLDSLFFDREPWCVRNPTKHERLGELRENVTYRQGRRCPICGATEKHFDDFDQAVLDRIERIPVSERWRAPLIENARINLSSDFPTYGSLFPRRSQVALDRIWAAIGGLDAPDDVVQFLQDAFLAILPQAKFKDYRSKSQDLHCPPNRLREVNLVYRYLDQVKLRRDGLATYGLPYEDAPIALSEARDLLATVPDESVALVLTDPPWNDGNPYFEKAQLYHPWLGYRLAADADRLQREIVVTDAPSRRDKGDADQWWADIEELFQGFGRVLQPLGHVVLYFRPIPARNWLANLNRMKLAARKAGLEPLLAIDVHSNDPAMRLQQSAAYAFADDVAMIFWKIPATTRRVFLGDTDVDQLAYQAAVAEESERLGPFTRVHWRARFDALLREEAPMAANQIDPATAQTLFLRYTDPVAPGQHLSKPDTPFADQLFDIPAAERLFTYVPRVVEELTEDGRTFAFDEFLLRLSEFLQNGTRALLDKVQEADLRALLDPYAEAIGPRTFRRRPLPALPEGIDDVLKMDPYDFEALVAHLLTAQGWTNVALCGRSGDRGVDVRGTDPAGLQGIVQCKRYRHAVDATPVQRLHSFAMTRGATRKILVTTSRFTRECVEEAQNTDTELVDGGALSRWIGEFGHG